MNLPESVNWDFNDEAQMHGMPFLGKNVNLKKKWETTASEQNQFVPLPKSFNPVTETTICVYVQHNAHDFRDQLTPKH